MGARGTAATIRWAWPPVDDDDHNRGQARTMYRAIGAAAAVATMLSVAAARSSGWRRRMWGAGATMTWLATGTGLAVGTAVTQLSRMAEEQSRTATAERHPDDP
jgi:hypothetical protein